MGPGTQGFVTGFFDRLDTNITARRDEARAYMNTQLATAQRALPKIRGEIKSSMQGSLQTARQLEAMGVPKNVILAVANQNIEDVDELYNGVMELRSRGIRPDANFYNEFAKGATQYEDTGESLAQAFTRIKEPLANNAEADPVGFEMDSAGTLFATMMGYNAMPRAMDKLENTFLEPGISAADVLSYTGEQQHPYGTDPVVLDPAVAYDAIQESKGSDEGGMDPLDAQRALKVFNDRIEVLKSDLETGTHTTEPGTPEREAQMAQFRKEAAEYTILNHNENAIALPEIYGALNPSSEATPEAASTDKSALQEPMDVPPPKDKPENVPSTHTIEGVNFTFVRMSEDEGYAVYTSGGQLYEFPIDQLPQKTNRSNDPRRK